MFNIHRVMVTKAHYYLKSLIAKHLWRKMFNSLILNQNFENKPQYAITNFASQAIRNINFGIPTCDGAL